MRYQGVSTTTSKHVRNSHGQVWNCCQPQVFHFHPQDLMQVLWEPAVHGVVCPVLREVSSTNGKHRTACHEPSEQIQPFQLARVVKLESFHVLTLAVNSRIECRGDVARRQSYCQAPSKARQPKPEEHPLPWPYLWADEKRQQHPHIATSYHDREGCGPHSWWNTRSKQLEDRRQAEPFRQTEADATDNEGCETCTASQRHKGSAAGTSQHSHPQQAQWCDFGGGPSSNWLHCDVANSECRQDPTLLHQAPRLLL
mmetsp:Transcript_7469/g.16327  ORF Transcript_7469/g.16327 Transcript_7469/m.16327 type:complete len:255 (+) Transcript_7469:566-1330(+)